MFCDIHLKGIQQDMLMNLIYYIRPVITLLKSLTRIPGTNELNIHELAEYIDGLIQDCSNSSALAMELL